jgi:hypothetical protein
MNDTENGTQYSDDEIAQRRDAALLKALSTPHKKQAEIRAPRAKGDPEGSPRRRQTGAAASVITTVARRSPKRSDKSDLG